jgi:hypothetical protein
MMANDLETQFETIEYTHETRRWNFEKYVNKHVELYNISEDLKFYGYPGINEASRVRKLMKGIKTNKLDSAKTRIMTDPEIKKSFDLAVNLYKDFIDTSLTYAPSSGQIAGVGLGRDAGGRGNGSQRRRNGQGGRNRNSKRTAQTAGIDVKDRYYTSQEYAKLSSEERSKLHELRNKRHQAGGSNRGSGHSKIASVTDGTAKTGTDSAGSSEITVQANNRTNPFLTRQRGNGKSD